jgi:hypothetical protein
MQDNNGQLARNWCRINVARGTDAATRCTLATTSDGSPIYKHREANGSHRTPNEDAKLPFAADLQVVALCPVYAGR